MFRVKVYSLLKFFVLAFFTLGIFGAPLEIAFAQEEKKPFNFETVSLTNDEKKQIQILLDNEDILKSVLIGIVPIQERLNIKLRIQKSQKTIMAEVGVHEGKFGTNKVAYTLNVSDLRFENNLVFNKAIEIIKSLLDVDNINFCLLVNYCKKRCNKEYENKILVNLIGGIDAWFIKQYGVLAQPGAVGTIIVTYLIDNMCGCKCP